ncbi:hypothetical protein SH661x_002346 [Planctomicrobium sp. SH661]|uniref:hypothetical protein n=1 Tax=Planctomicrobium sp. SH661 TaxID=3448124 RepID=UPI003F5B58C1
MNTEPRETNIMNRTHFSGPVLIVMLSMTLWAETPPRSAVPAIFTPNSRVLFQGDSITDGNRGRTSDPNHILGHGYAFLIAAKFGGEIPELLSRLKIAVPTRTLLHKISSMVASHQSTKLERVSSRKGVSGCISKKELHSKLPKARQAGWVSLHSIQPTSLHHYITTSLHHYYITIDRQSTQRQTKTLSLQCSTKNTKAKVALYQI